MKLFAREANEVCNKCSASGICHSSRAWWTKRRKILKKTGECPTFNAIKERENRMFGKGEKLSFGERLKFAREKMGLTQAKLAKLSQIDFTQICKFETNVRMPSLDNFRKLVIALRVSADYLLDINIKELWEGVEK